MVRKVSTLVLLVAVLAMVFFAVGCSNKKVKNPIADINSKQPDKVLFDRAMDAMKHNRWDVARLSLQTLINTYPESEYLARAKLGVGDSWYAEGGATGFAQAEIEYKDFETFFPNMPEAAEAQLKVANIHYRQMEKPDRDYTHAKRAEDEYKQLIQQYPDSKLVPEAKQRLMEVQEVLAEREYRVGRFYYLRESYPAAIARLQSIADSYPLYSGTDEALYLLGESWERIIDNVRANSQVPETVKGKLIAEYTKRAAAAYGRIITRYPATDRVNDAKERLAALHQSVPTPTEAAIKQSQAEEASRGQQGKIEKMWGVLGHAPDVTRASKVGEPTMEEEKETSATELAKETHDVLANAAKKPEGNGGTNATLGIETGKAGTGTPPASEAPPTSDQAQPQLDKSQAVNQAGTDQPAPVPPQANEANTPEAQQDQAQVAGQPASSTDKKTESTSKKKKKSGLRKLIPF
jgi:outer membrane protein assembly factor BamD